VNLLFAIFLVSAGAYGAQRIAWGATPDPRSRLLAGATIFVAMFLGAFHLQGFLELVLATPIVNLPLASAIMAAFLGIALIGSRVVPSSYRPPQSRHAYDQNQRWRRIPLVTAIGVGLVLVAAAILLVGGLPRGFEVKAYHLPIAIRVLRDGTLGIWDSSFMHAYPMNMSIWAGLFLYVVPERLVSLVNLPFLALLCAAIFALCRVAGSDKSAALMVTAGAATVPMVGFSALEVGADVAGVAFIAIAAFMVIARPGSRTMYSLIAGLAAGIAYGFKSLNLVPLGALGLVIIADCLFDFKRQRDRRSLTLAFAPVFVFALSALAMMSFWLIRNYVQAGNPLYPVYVPGLFDVFSWRAAPDFDLSARIETELEWVGASWQWLVYPWVEGHMINQNFKHDSGLGAFFAATIPGAVLLWPAHVLNVWRSPAAALFTGQTRAQAILYFVAWVIALAWWVLGDRQPRYAMAAFVLIFPLAAWLITQSAGRVRTAYEALLSICVLTMAFVMIVRLFAENGATMLQDLRAPRQKALEYPAAVDTVPQGALIANGMDRPVNYYLLGKGLQNRVVDAWEINRRFGTTDDGLRLTKDGVLASGVTHLYVQLDRAVATDGCVSLEEIDRLDRNPFNGQPYTAARVLYALNVCGAGKGS